MSELILVQRDENVATITLNNPEKRNALTKPAWEKLATLMQELEADDELRCIVFRGAGEKAFAAGADISEFAQSRANGAQAKEYGEVVERAIRYVAQSRHPTVAMIYGACTGGGLEIAASCDIRIAAEDAKFGMPINRLGHALTFSQMKGLLRLIGPARTSEFLLEGRIASAEEAVQIGLVNRIVPHWELEEEVHATVNRIASGAPIAARMHKRIIRRLEDPTILSQEELDFPYLSCDTEDYKEGVTAFLEKRRPDFKAK